MSKIHNGPHPNTEAYRKTVTAARASTAARDPLVDAAALALDLIATLADAGVFELKLDFPTDLDDRVDRLQHALDVAAKTAPAPVDAETAAKRLKLVHLLHTSSRRVLDTDAPDSLTRRTALLLNTVSSFMAQGHLTDVGGMLPRRLGEVALALNEVEVGAVEADVEGSGVQA